jgi:hypothetical protein
MPYTLHICQWKTSVQTRNERLHNVLETPGGSNKQTSLSKETRIRQEHQQCAYKLKIYDKSITMSLEKFCGILGIPMFVTAKKIQNRPADLVELYRGLTNDDDRTAQRGKIRNIQPPAIRYFTYYLATSILGRENTRNISNYHLAFLATALDVSKKYNLSALIARRLAARGPIYGGIIIARIVAALGLSIAPNKAYTTVATSPKVP